MASESNERKNETYQDKVWNFVDDYDLDPFESHEEPDDAETLAICDELKKLGLPYEKTAELVSNRAEKFELSEELNNMPLLSESESVGQEILKCQEDYKKKLQAGARRAIIALKLLPSMSEQQNIDSIIAKFILNCSLNLEYSQQFIQASRHLRELNALNQETAYLLLQRNSVEIQKINQLFIMLDYRKVPFNPETTAIEIMTNIRQLSSIHQIIDDFRTKSEKNIFLDSTTFFLICKNACFDPEEYQQYINNLILSYINLENYEIFTQENKAILDQNSHIAKDITQVFFCLSKINLLDDYKYKISEAIAKHPEFSSNVVDIFRLLTCNTPVLLDKSICAALCQNIANSENIKNILLKLKEIGLLHPVLITPLFSQTGKYDSSLSDAISMLKSCELATIENIFPLLTYRKFYPTCLASTFEVLDQNNLLTDKNRHALGEKFDWQNNFNKIDIALTCFKQENKPLHQLTQKVFDLIIQNPEYALFIAYKNGGVYAERNPDIKEIKNFRFFKPESQTDEENYDEERGESFTYKHPSRQPG